MRCVAEAELQAKSEQAREDEGRGGGGVVMNKPEGRCEHRKILCVVVKLKAGCSGLEPQPPIGCRCPTPSHESKTALVL